MIYEKCRDILLRESEFLQEAANIQEKIRIAVINREWDDFEEHINAMNNVENNMAELENEREKLFIAFDSLFRHNTYSGNDDAKGRFYTMVSHLPENEREDLTTIYRGLKLQALKLRVANESLMTYLVGIKSTLKEFFDLAFPDRAVKVYTPQGTHLSHDMRSMVLNQSF